VVSVEGEQALDQFLVVAALLVRPDMVTGWVCELLDKLGQFGVV
jgi:hypothetical protein